ncbi:MAG: hypothetical protein ACI87E_001062 [Mariniblastus sp.]|jgi:hypothetical protein
MFPCLILIAVLILGGHQLPADEPRMQEVLTAVNLDKTSAQIADPFNVTIRISALKGTQIRFPLVGDRIGELEIIETRDEFDIPDPDDSTQRTWTRELQLESLLTGEQTFPIQEIQVGIGSQSRIVRTEPKTIRIDSVLEKQTDPTKIRDIKSEQDIEIPPLVSYAWVGWLAGGCGSVVALGLVVGLIIGRKKWITPKQWATQELITLRLSEAMRAGDANSVFAAIETTTKTYLETQFGALAMSSTPDELMAEMKSNVSDPAIHLRLGALLSMIEHAKYAGQHFSSASLTTAVAETQALIDSMDAIATQPTNENQAPTVTNAEVN